MEADKILVANVMSKAKISYTRNIVTSTNFIDIRQLKLVEYNLKKEKYKYEIIRINEEAEKALIIFLPTYLSLDDINLNEYISCIKINIKKGQMLSHRDYMGGIYNLGIKREFIGEIFVYSDYSACVFCTPKIAEYLKYNLFRIGRYEVQLDLLNIEEVEIPKRMYKVIEINVASNRLDIIASEATRISRNKMVEKIISKEVFVNYEQVNDKSFLLNEQDIFSVKGIGKFKIYKFIGTSKKGNLIIEIRKYI